MSVYKKEDAHTAEGSFFIATRGTERSEYEITVSDAWISVDKEKGTVNTADPFIRVRVAINKDMLEKKAESYTAKGEISVKTGCGKVRIEVSTLVYDENDDVFTEENGMVVINAAHFDSLKDGKCGSFKVLKKLGRNEDAIKLFPVDRSIEDTADAPVAKYSFRITDGGEYRIIFITEAVNPYLHGKGIDITYSVNDGDVKTLRVVDEHFEAGSSYEWGQGVLKHVREPEAEAAFEAGINSLSFYGMRVENVLERILIVKKDVKLPDVYLGPAESIGKQYV